MSEKKKRTKKIIVEKPIVKKVHAKDPDRWTGWK